MLISLQLVYFVAIEFSMSRQDFFDPLTISIAKEFSFVAIDFSSLVLVAG